MWNTDEDWLDEHAFDGRRVEEPPPEYRPATDPRDYVECQACGEMAPILVLDCRNDDRFICTACANEAEAAETARLLADKRERRRRLGIDDDVTDAEPNERTGRRVDLTRALDIRSERVEWLWTERIALRGLTVVAGEKGLGKSILTNAYLPAALTRGKVEGALHGKPVDVLVVTAEDDWRAVVKPRLMSCHADLRRVHRVRIVDDNGEALFTLPDDVNRLEAAIRELRESGRTVRAIVVDPIGSFIPATVNTHADAPVRRALAPLAQLADRLDIAVIVVAHLTKDEAKRLIYRISGAGAFANAARSVLAIARNPEDPKGEQGLDRLIVHVATNWGRYAPTLAAHIESRPVDVDDGSKADVGFLVIDGESSVSVDELQSSRDDEDGSEVEEEVCAQLANGPKPSRDVKTTVAGKLRCSRKTVQRAAMRLRDRGELTIEEAGFPRSTIWALSGDTGLSSPVGTQPSPNRVPTEQIRMDTGDLPREKSSGDSGDTGGREACEESPLDEWKPYRPPVEDDPDEGDGLPWRQR